MNQALLIPSGAQWDAGRVRFAAAGMCGTPTRGRRDTPVPVAPPDPLNPNFAGKFTPIAKHAKNGAQSTYSGAIVTTLLDRDLVAAVLPANLELAQPLAPSTTHPVILLLGRQDDPLELNQSKTRPIPLAEPYTELILLIPYTVAIGQGLWHSYSARMYLDNVGAIAIGNGLYAYSKEWGDFNFLGTTTEVRHSGNTYFETDIAETAAWVPAAAAAALPGCANALQILDMPIVGHNALLGYVCSYFEWDLTTAEVAPAQSEHRFVQEFRPGMQGWVDLDFLSGALGGTFKVRNVRWRLSTDLPFPAC